MKNNTSEEPDSLQDSSDNEDSSSSEHCCTIEKATRIFENKELAKNSYFDKKHKQSYKVVSSYDIFSGSVEDDDIPPIEADIEEDGVYPIADNLACSKTNDQTAKQKKSVMKSNSYGNRKNYLKKLSAISLTNNYTMDKENEGVIIRMKNQESYYDGKDKYQSQLPAPPLYQLYENIRLRRSIYSQKAVDKSVDLSESDLKPDNIQNSIIYPDYPLPLVDKSSRINDRSTNEEDNDSIELEPNIDNDSYPDNKVFQLFSENSQRLRWAETEEGKKLIKMQKLGQDTIKWQEAQFEVITSEASYYKSLEILVNKIYKSRFMDCYKDKSLTYTTENLNTDPEDCSSPEFKPIISATQKHHLFSNILEIHIVSGELLKALESRWRENPLISDLSDILVEFCQEKLKPYVTYLRNQRYQTDTYNRLLNLPEFLNVIKTFENDPDCGKMNLCSFLMLPMQRVLRLKLLMTVVKSYTPKNLSTSGSDAAIEALEKLIKECSDEKMVMEQKEEILIICNRLIFKDKMNVSIGSKPLLKNGQMKIAPNNIIASKSIGSRFMNRNNNKAQLYLFEDQLIIAKRRKLPLCVSSPEEREIVVDTCPRFHVKFDMPPNSPKLINRSPTNFNLVLVRGMRGPAEYACTVETQEELNDWKNVFSTDNHLRDGFDFNEAFVIKDYIPASKKEMELKKGQILNIIKRIDQNKAIASSGGRQGEISLKYVQFLSTPQPNHDLLNIIRAATCQKEID